MEWIRKAMKALISGLLVLTLFALSGFSGACEEIRSEVFRLHIMAHSDSEEDQTLKLRVRDALLSETERLFRDCHSKEEAIVKAKERLAELQAAAESVVRESGFDYGVTVSVTNMHFQTRVYDNITLPAGKYDALRIVLGKGEGHNWWCVLYPGLCLPGADGSELQEVLNEGEQDIVTDSEPYAVGFRLAEFFQWLSSLFQ